MNTPSKILIATLLVGGAAAAAVPVLAQDATPVAPMPPVTQAHLSGGPRGGPGMDGPGGRGGHSFGPGQIIREFDTDHNGTLSTDEINAALAKYDTNKDGSLSLEEYKALFADLTNQTMVRSFQFLDRDGNAVVSEQEFAQPLEHMQQRMANAENHGPRGGQMGNDQQRGPRHGDDDHGQRGGNWRPWR